MSAFPYSRLSVLSAALLLIGCAASPADENESGLLPGHLISQIYWSDGDSGRIDGVPFRLSDVDAPETGGVGAAIGGAECEAERERGFAAKAFMVEETREGDLRVGRVVDVDRYDRVVLTILDDGRDLSGLGVEAGHLRRWRWRNGRAIDPRPEWCSS